MKNWNLVFLVFCLSLVGCDSGSGNRTAVPLPDTTAPVFTTIDSLTLSANSVDNVVSIGVTDNVSSTLSIAASADNPPLLVDAGLVVDSAGAELTLSITPNMDVIGTVEITLTATDEAGNSAITSFSVDVVEQVVSATQFILQVFSQDQNSEPRNVTAVILDNDVQSQQVLLGLAEDGDS